MHRSTPGRVEPPGAPPALDMVWVPGGTFRMGATEFYPEERPVVEVTVSGFWMDDHPVTVGEFRRFVKATGHVTVAERPPDFADYPDADPALLIPGSSVFRRTRGPVDLDDHTNWWSWVPGAQWRYPEGPGSTVGGRERHPVTHIAYDDARAYAAWAGKLLPTEAEWEFAARGGLDSATYAWGNEFAPRGRQMANTWQGEFPWQNLLLDKYERTSPIRVFPPNGYGLYDVTGNVWEWTSDVYTPRHTAEVIHACCGPRQNAPARSPDSSDTFGRPGKGLVRMVIKGGSHLCAPNYCHRYRPAARSPQTVETSTGHLGFRCIVRPAEARTSH